MKALFSYFLFALCTSQAALAADEITLTSKQIQALGIGTAVLPAKQYGELSGMPAQVVVPNNQMFIISTPLPGMLEQILVGIGDTVKKGQPLARLQSPALVEAQRGLLQASTQAQLAKGNFARDEQLWRDGIIAESRYRAAQSQYMDASAALAERKQMLRLSGMSEGDIAKMQSSGKLNSLLTIVSPTDGAVLEKTASPGQRLDAAVPLFKIARLEPLHLEIQAPLANTRGLKVGAIVTVPEFGVQGKLIAIGRSLSGGNQAVILRALIQQGAESLRPGQFVEVNIATAPGSGAQWNVPNSALVHTANKTLVFVQTAKGFRAEAITIIHEGAHNSVISGKFEGNEKIAVHGVSALKASLMGIGGGE